MAARETILVKTVAEFRSLAQSWDDLWLRSDVTAPTARGELIAQCVEHIAPQSEFRAVIVREGERFLAGIPLVASKIRGLFTVGALPAIAWAPYGTLLVDLECDAAEVLRDLASCCARRLPWKVLWLDQVLVDRPCWQVLREAAVRCGMFADVWERGRIAWIELGEDWQAYMRRLSKNYRRQLDRAGRRLEQQGTVTLRVESNLDRWEVAGQMRRAMELEDGGWKGAAKTSMLRTPGMADFYTRQAEQLSEWGQLQLAFLDLDGEPIAFEYGWVSKSVYHSRKIGYDHRYSAFSPGHLLLQKLLEHFYRAAGVQAVDCIGPLTDAIQRWRPTSYGIGRVVVAARGSVWRSMYRGYKRIASALRQTRNERLYPSRSPAPVDEVQKSSD